MLREIWRVPSRQDNQIVRMAAGSWGTMFRVGGQLPSAAADRGAQHSAARPTLVDLRDMAVHPAEPEYNNNCAKRAIEIIEEASRIEERQNRIAASVSPEFCPSDHLCYIVSALKYLINNTYLLAEYSSLCLHA